MKLYTRKEVSESEKKLIIIDCNVYDITDYINEHPGGEEILYEVIGLDCTLEFNNSGHSTEAYKLLENFIVGKINNNVLNNNEKK